MTTAKARFVAGPAPMATMRFQIDCRQYASSERLSRDVLQPAVDPACWTASGGRGLEGVELEHAPARSPRPSRARFSRSDGPTSSGASRMAPPKNASTSDACGRVMPGIVT